MQDALGVFDTRSRPCRVPGEGWKDPDTLNMLAPDYLHEVKIDQFSGHELRNSSHDDGYLLYSVGADKKDSHGLSFDEGADDLSVRAATETVTK